MASALILFAWALIGPRQGLLPGLGHEKIHLRRLGLAVNPKHFSKSKKRDSIPKIPSELVACLGKNRGLDHGKYWGAGHSNPEKISIAVADIAKSEAIEAV